MAISHLARRCPATPACRHSLVARRQPASGYPLESNNTLALYIRDMAFISQRTAFPGSYCYYFIDKPFVVGGILPFFYQKTGDTYMWIAPCFSFADFCEAAGTRLALYTVDHFNTYSCRGSAQRRHWLHPRGPL